MRKSFWHRTALGLGCFLVAATALGKTTPPSLSAPAVTEAFTTMLAAGEAYLNDNTDCPGVISAANLSDNLGDFTVIDIRAEFAYLAGHIPGAYHSSLATLLADVGTTIPTHKPLVIADYTGQTAGHAKIALELVGYEDTKSLVFGMCSWSPLLSASWDNNVGDNLATPEVTNNNAELTPHAFPDLTGDPTTIVAERVAAMLAAGFKGRSYGDIRDNLDDYFIINYFGEADYLGMGASGVPGHIPGAYQFTPYASLGGDQMLDTLPTNMPIVVYDWTGQHSSQVTAYLNMLGYNAYSLKFGANNLFYSDLLAHRWTPSGIEYPLEEGVSAVPDLRPAPVTLLGNHPNPFNPATTISYRLGAPARVRLRIYDLAGRRVRELIAGTEQGPGTYDVEWQGRDDAGRELASGTYFYRLDAGAASKRSRMLLLK